MNTIANLFVRVFWAFVYWMLISVLWSVVVWLFKLSLTAPRMMYNFLKALAEAWKKEFVTTA